MQVVLCCNQMQYLADSIGDRINNPRVTAAVCGMMGDRGNQANFVGESVSYGNAWTVNYTISTNTDEADVAVSHDYLPGPPVNKSEWVASLMTAIGTFDGWEVPTILTDVLVTVDGNKPVFTFNYTGKSNVWLNIAMSKPDGGVDTIKLTVNTDGTITMDGSDQYGPFGSPAQVPC